VLQPTSNLAELGYAILLVQLPGCAHQRCGLGLLLARQPTEHIAQFVNFGIFVLASQIQTLH
jgi:hypothetical protein